MAIVFEHCRRLNPDIHPGMLEVLNLTGTRQLKKPLNTFRLVVSCDNSQLKIEYFQLNLLITQSDNSDPDDFELTGVDFINNHNCLLSVSHVDD